MLSCHHYISHFKGENQIHARADRAQQGLAVVLLLFSTASGIRNVGLGGKIGTFMGPFQHAGSEFETS